MKVISVDLAANKHECTSAVLIVNGEVMRIEDISYTDDRSTSLWDSQTLSGELRVSSGKYQASGTIKLRCFGRRWIKRLVRRVAAIGGSAIVDYASEADRQLWHVERGCGPGGRRNSKVSRRIASALRRWM